MNPARTVTGGFPIGFRQGGGDWQQDAGALARWASAERFACVDFPQQNAGSGLEALRAVNLRPGTVDLFSREDYEALITSDSAARRRVVAVATDRIEEYAALGTNLFFAVTLPADPTVVRAENFAAAVETFKELVPALESTGTRLALEGWPGRGAVCCTPETFRAFFAAVGSDRLGINYDPSHLVRMGIDPWRFAQEFAPKVFHVHAKDAAISQEDLYEYGHELPPTFKLPPRWSGAAWRYTVPGRGGTPWRDVLRTLRDAGYRGLVSIELEDRDFHGTPHDEQRGLCLSRDFLEAC